MRSFYLFLFFFSSLGFALLPRSEKPFATAELKAKSGSKVKGSVLFLKKTDRLVLNLDLSRIDPGEHALHIHEKGDCSAPDGKSAGDHFNPQGFPHGAPDKDTHHAGDFGNIEIPKEGWANLEVEIKIPPRANETIDWEEYVGKSLVIHKGKDDFKSQPAGNSGEIIACGVIERIKNLGE